MIADMDIRSADPAAVVEQFEPFIKKIAKKFIPLLERSGAVDLDDLIQVGRMAILQVQKRYDPTGDASFLTFIYKPVKWAIMCAAGINSNTGKAPEQLVYLDEPIPGYEDEELSRMDILTDPDAIPLDEPIIEDETHRETSEQVHAALARMKSEKQREVIERVYLNGQDRAAAAADMEIKPKALYALDKAGRSTLRRDYRLRQYAQEMPFIHVGVARFNSTWTSSTELLALRRLEAEAASSPEAPANTSAADRIREIWNREHDR